MKEVAAIALEGVRSRDDRFWPRLMDLLGWPAPGHVTRREAIELLVTGSTGPSLRRTVAEIVARSIRGEAFVSIVNGVR